ncbi:MAG: hypothetical protein LC670_08885 [Flavobacteriales bacterium]|nr:hypothetical protein [Flavobacteriales bacterium]
MDQAEIAKVVSIFLLSAVKLLFAPGAAIASGFSLEKTVMITSCGGCSGVLFFYYTGFRLTEKIGDMLRQVKILPKKKRAPKKIVISDRKKFVVRVRQRFGMAGLLLLTPVAISIPIGAVVLARFYKDNKFMLPLLLLSVVLWCFVLTYFSVSVKQTLLDF